MADTKNDVKKDSKEKKGFLKKTAKAASSASGWVVDKIVKYPKMAATLLFGVGTAVGFAARIIYEGVMADASSVENNVIETEFVPTDDEVEQTENTVTED